MTRLQAFRFKTDSRAMGPWFIVTACLLAMTSGCTIEDPALPTFSTQLAVPVGTHDLTVAELIEDQDYLYADEDSILFFTVEGDTTHVGLDLEFSADLDGLDTQASIGDFALEDVGPLGYAFTLSEIWPTVNLLPPGAYPVPAFDFDLASDAEEINGIVSAQVSSGIISLTLTNDLPIPLAGPSTPEMIIAEVVNAISGDPIAVLVFDQEIPPGTSAEATADLGGVELAGNLRVNLTGGSTGASAVTLDPADALSVELSLSNLVVSEASAAIGPQSFEQNGSVALPDSLHIIEAVVASGTINVSLSNGLPLAATVYVYFNEFETSEGDPYLLTFEMPRNGVEVTMADMAGAIITSNDGAPLDSLSYTVGVYSPGSEGAVVDVQAGSHISATMAPTSLALGEVTGLIPERTFVLEPMTETIDIPDELDGLCLAAATLTVDLYNGTGIAGTLDLSLSARNASGETASLTTTATIAPARSAGMTRTTIRLDETNSTIADLISLLPETFTFSGQVSVGGDDAIGTVRPDDEAMVLWRADAPLRLSIDSSEIDRNPAALDLDGDLRDQIDNHLLSAEFVIEIGNHFPFGLNVEFLVGPDSLSTLTNPELIVGPLIVDSGLIGETTRYVESSVMTRHVVTLNEMQIRAFTKPNAFTALRALIPGTNGAEVLLRAGDGLTARGALTVNVLIEDD